MTLRAVSPLLVLIAIAAAPGGASAQEIARPDRATPVDADLGLVVWSEYDAGADGFRLMLRAQNGEIRPLPAPLSPVPFEADIGDDAERHRVVVYSACPSGPRSCDVHLVRVADGADAVVPAAARPGRGEHAPTISRGRLAWATGGGTRTRPRVWLQDLDSGRRPAALPALPRRSCARDHRRRRRCVPMRGLVDELELRGDTLAQITLSLSRLRYATQLRLVNVERRRARRLLSFGVGESGQRLVGASLDEDNVYAYKACFGDPSGCERGAGAFRYGLANRRIALAESSRQLSGFSVDRRRVATVEGSERRMCELEQGGYPGVDGATGPCPVTLDPLPRFRRVRR